MGSIFSSLTKPGVQHPSGATTNYDNPAQATQALAAASAATAQPNTSSVDGTIGPDGSSTVLANNNAQAPVAAQPKIVTPTWQQAQEKPELMTKGGKLLSLLQTGLEGAARGAAAGVPTNPHISPGLGPSLAAGVETPFAMKQQANALLQQNLEQQKEKAQIAALPLQAQTELGLKRAQTEWYNQRGEAVGEHNLKPGDTLVDKDGNVVTHGGSVADTAAAKAQGKGAGTIAAVQNAGGTIEQAFAALGIKNPTPQNKTEMQAYIDANKGDIGAAIKQRNADRVNTSGAIHAAIV